MDSTFSTFSYTVYQNRIHPIKRSTDSVRLSTEMHVKSSHKVSAILVSFDQKQNLWGEKKFKQNSQCIKSDDNPFSGSWVFNMHKKAL
jgi:hypothetical protein